MRKLLQLTYYPRSVSDLTFSPPRESGRNNMIDNYENTSTLIDLQSLIDFFNGIIGMCNPIWRNTIRHEYALIKAAPHPQSLHKDCFYSNSTYGRKTN